MNFSLIDAMKETHGITNEWQNLRCLKMSDRTLACVLSVIEDWAPVIKAEVA